MEDKETTIEDFIVAMEPDSFVKIHLDEDLKDFLPEDIAAGNIKTTNSIRIACKRLGMVRGADLVQYICPHNEENCARIKGIVKEVFGRNLSEYISGWA